MSGEKLGFLRACMDRRFSRAFQDTFEQETGLRQGDYWFAANKGGAAVPDRGGRRVEVDYAVEHGAVELGWGAHLDVCGGLPGVSDKEIAERLARGVQSRARRLPEASHRGIIVSTGGIEVFTPAEAARILRRGTTISQASRKGSRR